MYLYFPRQSQNRLQRCGPQVDSQVDHSMMLEILLTYVLPSSVQHALQYEVTTLNDFHISA